MANKNGFSLIELLIAMVIILVAMLGFYKSAIVAIEGNTANILRDEGVRLAQQVVNEIRALPKATLEDNTGTWTSTVFDDLLGYQPTVTVPFRNDTWNYNAVVSVADFSPLIQVTVTVGWDYKDANPKKAPTNTEFQHSVTTIVR